MEKILKILGQRGRITIPWELRHVMGFARGDVVSSERSGGTVLVRREKLCDGCKAGSAGSPSHVGHTAAPGMRPEDMTADELRAEIVRLSALWAGMQAGGDGGA